MDRIAVIKPIFSGILALKRGIISTLAMTIPIPVKAVPTKSRVVPPNTRIITPTVSREIPRNIALAFPIRFPIDGAKREKIAKVINESVVRNPASPLEISKSSRMNGISGPTDAIEVRKLIEIKAIPKINKSWLFLDGVKEETLIQFP